MRKEDKDSFKPDKTNREPKDSYGVPLRFHEMREEEKANVAETMDNGIRTLVHDLFSTNSESCYFFLCSYYFNIQPVFMLNE